MEPFLVTLAPDAEEMPGSVHEGEEWTPRKVIRRMLEHEREHIAQLRQLIEAYQRASAN